MLKHISLKKKIIIFIIASFIYPIILLTIYGCYNNEKIIKERFLNYIEEDTYKAADRVEKDFDIFEKFTQEILYDTHLYDLIKKEPSQNSNSITLYNFKREMTGYLQAIINSKQEFDLVAIQLEESSRIYTETNSFDSIDLDLELIKQFSHIVGSERNVVYHFHKQDNRTDIYMLRAVYDPNTFERIGIISFRMDNNYFSDILLSTYKEPAEVLYLYSEDGQPLMMKGNEKIDATNIIEEYQLFLKPTGTHRYNINGSNYYIISETINKIGLKIISIISTDILLSDLKKVYKITFLLIVVSIPFFILLANLLYKHIVNPIKLLIQKMSNFKEGKLDTTIPINRKDEIGFMFDSFNDMSKRIKHLIEVVYEEQIALKDAELEALQAQINPHFLYNTLENINWKAQLADQKDISDMIQALSKLIDANMNRRKEKNITIRKELEYMDNYIFLVQKRYGEKIKYTKNMNEEVLESYIPKLILQPLIENAVNHGIQPIGTGEIKLSIKKDNDIIKIIIADNGIGIEEKKLKVLLEKLEESNEQKNGTKRIGLKNVYKRLKLIYGEALLFEIKSKYQEGTTILIQIPIKGEKEGIDDVQNLTY